MMTKKHFVLLANIIRAHVTAERLSGSDCGAERRMIGELLPTLVKTNPRFDSERFIQACDL